MYTFHIIQEFKLYWLFFRLLFTWQDYGDSIELDGFDIDYGVRIFLGSIFVIEDR